MYPIIKLGGVVKTIYMYTDYRQFLKDRYAELKKTQRSFSYRYFSQKAGFASPNFLKLVMEGQRNLSQDGAQKFAQALKLGVKESRFFEILVHYNQSKDGAQKQSYYEQMLAFGDYRKAHHLIEAQYAYLTHWYYPAIVELAHLKNFQEDPQWIASNLGGRISIREVREALEVVESIGLLQRNTGGKLVPGHAALTTGPEAASLAAYSYHKQILELAQEAVTAQSPGEREFGAITMAVSATQLAKLKDMVRDFRRTVVNYLSTPDANAEAVYQFGVQMFALTELKGATPSGEEKG
jgi:uncharacterized protein (TIGR02147 family)